MLKILPLFLLTEGDADGREGRLNERSTSGVDLFEKGRNSALPTLKCFTWDRVPLDWLAGALTAVLRPLPWQIILVFRIKDF